MRGRKSAATDTSSRVERTIATWLKGVTSQLIQDRARTTKDDNDSGTTGADSVRW